jgi:predicted aminopeptidase
MRYRHMRDRRWGRYRGYDAWFASPINNAKLAATSVYSDRVTAFLRLFDLFRATMRGSMRRFDGLAH